MPDRLLNLKFTYDGLVKTGIPLVGFNGTNLYAGGAVDDIGIYYFIPKFATFFNLPFDQAVSLFYGGILLCSFFIASAAAWFFLKSRLAKIYAMFCFLVLTILPWKFGDNYTFLSTTTLVTVPVFLAAYDRLKNMRWMGGILFMLGVVLSLGNFLRSHAGTGALIFIFVLVFFHKEWDLKRKTLFLIILGLGMACPKIYFQHLIKSRNQFLKENVAGYTPVPARHPLWHSVYLGLGFLNNEYVREGIDDYAFQKARSVKPEVILYSHEYESILRNEVFKIIKSHPYFFMRTIFTKLGVLFMYFLLIANIGFYFAIRLPKPREFDFAYLGGMAAHAAIGLAVTPYHFYVLGFLAFSALFGIHSVDFFISSKRDVFNLS